MANILIIGGSSGIGEQLTLQLATAGNNVYASYNTKILTSTTKNLTYFKLNVLDEDVDLSFFAK